ncbi:MAG: agmatine deiminase family protein [Planctomycetota bacterium]|nr:MAG: agmatine deiminase family protein [Planctomycetota bacterium]
MTSAPIPSDAERTDGELLPGRRGYRLAAEWEPHAATWLAWPHNRDTWPGSFDPIPGVWTELVELLAAHEPVHILAGTPQVMDDAQARIGHVRNVSLHDVPTNDAWIRDYGPMFLVAPNAAPATLVDWEYNAWGQKYPPFDLDNAVPATIATRLGQPSCRPGVVLEGGAIDADGQGTVLANDACLVGPRRNAALDRADFEQLLHDYAGVQHVVWLAGPPGAEPGIAGDDTDGHIDQLARFVAPGHVVVACEDDRADDNFALLGAVERQLRGATDASGNKFDVTRLPMPRPVLHRGARLPASYANFYVANGVVVVPQFHDPADDPARETLAALFPGREIYPLDSRQLVRGLGGVHCVTLSQPASPPDRPVAETPR